MPCINPLSLVATIRLLDRNGSTCNPRLPRHDRQMHLEDLLFYPYGRSWDNGRIILECMTDKEAREVRKRIQARSRRESASRRRNRRDDRERDEPVSPDQRVLIDKMMTGMRAVQAKKFKDGLQDKYGNEYREVRFLDANSPINHVPDNVKKDWLMAAFEVLTVALQLHKNSKNERPQSLARKILVDLHRRFPKEYKAFSEIKLKPVSEFNTHGRKLVGKRWEHKDYFNRGRWHPRF